MVSVGLARTVRGSWGAPPGTSAWGAASFSNLTVTSTGLPNTPTDPQVLANLASLLAFIPRVEDAVGSIRITSGYRSPAVNAKIGGAKGSQHMAGQAIDFAPSAMTSEQAAGALYRSGLPVDQVIWYHPSRGGHVHLSHRATGNRRAFLYAPGGSKGYLPWTPGTGAGAGAALAHLAGGRLPEVPWSWWAASGAVVATAGLILFFPRRR